MKPQEKAADLLRKKTRKCVSLFNNLEIAVITYLSVKRLLHLSHLNGLSPVCVLIWVCRELDWEKPFLHTVHLKGRSPVCVRKWTVRLPDWLKARGQKRHLYGFSPLWIRMWTFSADGRRNILWHSWHVSLLSLLVFSPLAFLASGCVFITEDTPGIYGENPGS